VFELKSAKEMKGSVRLPVSDDLFFLSVVVACATKIPATITAPKRTERVAKWESAFAGHCTFTYENDNCVVTPYSNSQSPIELSYDDIPYRDFVVPLLLGMGKTLVVTPLPLKRLEAWASYATDCFCGIQTTASGITLTETDQFRIRDTTKTIDMVHPILGFALGLGKNIVLTIDSVMTSPLRQLLPAIGYDFAVCSNVTHDKNENPILRRMRFLQMVKKDENRLLYRIDAKFAKRKDTPVEITLPGDDALGAVLIAAKCNVPRGGLVIENIGLESWNTQALQLVKKMGGNVSTQETGSTSFGAVGNLTIQKFTLAGRKIECRPLFQYTPQLPAMLVLAAIAQGQSVFRGLEDLRKDEPDGIAQLIAIVNLFGIRYGEMPDGLVIDGGRQYDGSDCPDRLQAHAAASCVAIALHAMGRTTINDEAIEERWPDFYRQIIALCEYRE